VKNLLCLVLVALCLLGCSEDPSVSGETSAPVVEALTVRDVACLRKGAPLTVPADGSIRLAVTSEVGEEMIEAFLVAAEAWGGAATVMSVTRVAYEDVADPTTLHLSACGELRDPADQAWAWTYNGAIWLNHTEWFEQIGDEHKAIALAHELGHVLGLPDSDVPGTVMHFPSWIRPTTSDVGAAKCALGHEGCAK
jgi:hypothetical protein